MKVQGSLRLLLQMIDGDSGRSIPSRRQGVLGANPLDVASTPCSSGRVLWGSLKRSARAVQLFECLAVLETHTLRY